jgi:hypothetical protein
MRAAEDVLQECQTPLLLYVLLAACLCGCGVLFVLNDVLIVRASPAGSIKGAGPGTKQLCAPGSASSSAAMRAYGAGSPKSRMPS